MYVTKRLKSSYFFTSFFWSTISKFLNAILGFISVPLLLGYFGKADYGLIAIATAWNGYVGLMDLGMNTGAVRYFSQWIAEGRKDYINNVARTNISFYLIISLINIAILLYLAFGGERFFSVTPEQFMKLRYCFLILCVFSSISWITHAYTQLLIAYKQVSYMMIIQSILVLLRFILLGLVFLLNLSLVEYFFILTLIISIAVIPYTYKCRRQGYIDSIKPAGYWKDFKCVLSFSLALFALSLFQLTAKNSRPIILSIFAVNGAESVTDFRIIEVIPNFIIMICGTFLSIFLPKTTEIFIKADQKEICGFVYKWTSLTTIIVCVMAIPFAIGSQDIISAYVGKSSAYLSKWLAIWSVFLIIQMHSTPAYSMILSLGKTKPLVISTAVCCVISIIVNISLCKIIPVGSAVLGYLIYLTLQTSFSYIYYYKRYLQLSRAKVLSTFFKPTILAIITGYVVYYINVECFISDFFEIERIQYVLNFLLKSLCWIIVYAASLFFFRVIDFRYIREVIRNK